MKKILLLLLIFGFSTTLTYAQATKVETQKTWRINFLNPGIEIELPTGQLSTFSAGVGIGYSGSYPDLTVGSGSGMVAIIAPFLDLQEKWYYNLKKRAVKGKRIDNNSGNFISFRLLTRGGSITDNINRTSNLDFAFGPTWGIQREYGKRFHLLFDVGPQFYFDTKGNGNIWPLMLQLNLGFDLGEKR